MKATNHFLGSLRRRRRRHRSRRALVSISKTILFSHVGQADSDWRWRCKNAFFGRINDNLIKA